MGDYHINVVCSEEDECYVADTPEGSAGRRVRRAIAAWVDAAREEGKPVPPPHYRPAIYQSA